MKYTLRFFCEWNGGCLWPADDVTRDTFDLGPYDLIKPCPLPLSDATLKKCSELTTLHDTSINQEYPPDPGPWDTGAWEQFSKAVDETITQVREELGSDFDVIDAQQIGYGD